MKPSESFDKWYDAFIADPDNNHLFMRLTAHKAFEAGYTAAKKASKKRSKKRWVCPQCFTSVRKRVTAFREKPKAKCPDHFNLDWVEIFF